MGKTLKWLAVHGAVSGVVFLLVLEDGLVSGGGLDADVGDLLVEVFGITLLAGCLGVTYPFAIYFMYQWTSAFNRKHFGHASRADWDAERRDREAGLS